MKILDIFKEKCVDAFNRSKYFLTQKWSWWSIDLLKAHNQKLKGEYGIVVLVPAVVGALPLGLLALILLAAPELLVLSIIYGAMAGLFLLPAVPTLVTNVVLPAINIIENVGLAVANTILSLVIVPLLTLKDVIKEAYNKRVSGYYDKILPTMTDDEFENYVVTPLKQYTPTSDVSCELKKTITRSSENTATKKAKLSLFLKDNLSRGLTSHLFFAFETIENDKALQRNKAQDTTATQCVLEQEVARFQQVSL